MLCPTCQRPTGIFRKAHQKCREERQDRLNRLRQLAATAAETPHFNRDQLREEIERLQDSIPHTIVHQAKVQGWQQGLPNSTTQETTSSELAAQYRRHRDTLARNARAQTHKTYGLLRDSAFERFSQQALKAATNPQDRVEAINMLLQTVKTLPIGIDQERLILANAWQNAVAHILECDLPSASQEHNLLHYIKDLKITVQEVNNQGAHTALLQAATLRDTKLSPHTRQIQNYNPNKLGRKEIHIWSFREVIYTPTDQPAPQPEPRPSTQYRRPEEFRKNYTPAPPAGPHSLGTLTITSQRLIFHSNQETLTIPIKMIDQLAPTNEGFEISLKTRKRANHSFTTGDGWFCANLLETMLPPSLTYAVPKVVQR